MKKARLTKILVEGDPELLKNMSSEIEEFCQVQIEDPPETGLVMVKARDSISMKPFYIGENLVTECTVSVNGTMGMGVLMGEEPVRAYQIAVIDAAFNADIAQIERWKLELEQEEERIAQRVMKEQERVSRSRVQFDTMEDYNGKS